MCVSGHMPWFVIIAAGMSATVRVPIVLNQPYPLLLPYIFALHLCICSESGMPQQACWGVTSTDHQACRFHPAGSSSAWFPFVHLPCLFRLTCKHAPRRYHWAVTDPWHCYSPCVPPPSTPTRLSIKALLWFASPFLSISPLFSLLGSSALKPLYRLPAEHKIESWVPTSAKRH